MCPPIDKLRPWILTAEIMKQWNYTQVVNNPNPLTAWMDADRVDAMLVDDIYLYLRTRKQGDHFHPLGLGGATVRLSDLFINAKLPLAWRDYLPLLATNGEILWVVGIRLSQCVMVRPETRRVLRLRFLRQSETAPGEAGKERNFG
jgi:tRNA(Ile)-lysidine synthetase-like protein